jgi:hypothetical protein
LFFDSHKPAFDTSKSRDRSPHHVKPKPSAAFRKDLPLNRCVASWPDPLRSVGHSTATKTDEAVCALRLMILKEKRMA